jgi:hypothetical protein
MNNTKYLWPIKSFPINYTPIQLYTPHKAVLKNVNSIKNLGVSLSTYAKYAHPTQERLDKLQPIHCNSTTADVSITNAVIATIKNTHLNID